MAEFLKNSQEEKPQPEITRRELFRRGRKAALGAGAAWALSHIEAPPVFSTEVKEGMSWEKGIEAFMKDVFESPVETGGVFVRTNNGEDSWFSPSDGTSGEISKNIGGLFEEFGQRMKEGKIKDLMDLHTHQLTGSEKEFTDIGVTVNMIEKMREGKHSLLSIPPSEGDIDVMNWVIWAMNLRKYGMDTHQLIGVVADSLGLWKYQRDKNPNSPFNLERAEWKKVSDKWWGMVNKKTAILPHEELVAARKKFSENDQETVAKYLGSEEMSIHEEHLRINDIIKEQKSRFYKIRRAFIKKSLEVLPKGEDYEDLIRTYVQSGVTLSFTPYQELGLSYKNLHKK